MIDWKGWPRPSRMKGGRLKKKWRFYFWASHNWERYLSAISLDKKLPCIVQMQIYFLKLYTPCSVNHTLRNELFSRKDFLSNELTQRCLCEVYDWLKKKTTPRFFCDKPPLSHTHTKRGVVSVIQIVTLQKDVFRTFCSIRNSLALEGKPALFLHS